MDIVIHFNPEKGYDEAALLLARRLFAVYDERIDSLALIPVEDEEFDLCLNGSLIQSQCQSGREPRVADMLTIVGTNDRQPKSGTCL